MPCFNFLHAEMRAAWNWAKNADLLKKKEPNKPDKQTLEFWPRDDGQISVAASQNTDYFIWNGTKF